MNPRMTVGEVIAEGMQAQNMSSIFIKKKTNRVVKSGEFTC